MGRQYLTLRTGGANPVRARLFQALLLGTMVHIQEEVVSPLY
jgi:hypothetical protein